MQEQKLQSQSAKAKKKVLPSRKKTAENVFYESSSQERPTGEATDSKEFCFKKRSIHTRIFPWVCSPREKIRESQLTTFTELWTKV